MSSLAWQAKENAALKLIHKCLIFCLIVLSVQIGTFVFLATRAHESQQEVERVTYSNKVISYAGEIVENLHEAMFCLSAQVVMPGSQASKRFHAVADKLPALVEDLKSEKLVNQQDREDLDAVAKRINFVMDAFRIVEEKIETRQSPANLAEYFTLIRLDLKPHVADILEIIGRMTERHSALKQKNASATASSSELVHLMLMSGFATSVLAALAMVIGFNKEISGRIGIISDNILLAAGGRQLKPRQRGDDEIAQLDRQFHTLTQALSEAMENERRLFENMPVGLITFDQTGRIENANPCAESMLGRSAETIRGQRLSNIVSTNSGGANSAGANLEVVEELISRQATSQVKGEPVRVELKRADHTVFPAEIYAADYQLRNERKLVVSILDITAREEVNKLKEEFISILGHDIRAPLASIDACLSLIIDGAFGDLPDAGIENVRTGRAQCSRLFRLTNELLEMAKLEAGKVVVEARQCSVSNLIDMAVEVVDLDARQRLIEIVKQESDLVVLADVERTVQILQNFLANAVKFSPDGKKVIVLATRESDAVKIAVRDEGPGIDAELVPDLFQRFKQAKAQDGARGTGLGLAICKMMAECQGGTVGVETAPGAGSTFWLRLPAS